MTPAQYAAKFLSLRVFLTDPAKEDAPPTIRMALPDAKQPLSKPAPPLDDGSWSKPFSVDRYRLEPSGYAYHLAQALRNQSAIGIRVMRIDGTICTYSVTHADIK